MFKTIEVVFDGKTFVPTSPVDLPTGTKVTVALPEVVGKRDVSVGPAPPSATLEERTEWERLCEVWATAALPWATVDEALAYSRGRVRPETSGTAP